MLLYKAILVTTFGRNSSHPFRVAIFRLGGICSIAVGLSWLLSQGVEGIPVVPAANAAYLVFTTAFTVQLAVLFVLLASLSITRISNSDSLARLLLVLPISRLQRWAALLLPSFILAGIAAIMTSWPLVVLLSKAGLHPLLFTAGSITGIVAALGSLHGMPRKLYWIQIAGIPLVLWGEYTLVTTINSPASSEPMRAGASLLLSLLFGSLCLLFFRSSNHLTHDISRNSHGKNVLGTSLPTVLWFVKKIVRAKTTRLGFVTAFGMSLAATLFFSRQGADPYAFALLAAILAAAFTSDIRSLAAHSKPAEITSLRATTRFVAMHAVAAVVCSVVVVLPLIAGAVIAGLPSPEQTGFVVQLLFGVSAGIFSGTLIVPVRRDIMGQLLSTLLCVGILVAMPYLPIVNALDDLGVTLYQSSLAIVLFVVAGIIEYQRNHYNWRKKAWKTDQ